MFHMTTKKRKTWRNMLTIRKLFIDSGNTFESHGVTERLTFLLFGTEHVQASVLSSYSMEDILFPRFQ